MASLRVALVHDWLTGMRGGEKVLLELCRLFPGAPVYTLLHTAGSVDPEIEARAPTTSWLQRLPGAHRGYRNYLPLFPAAIRSLRLQPVDLVVSTSHAVAKGVCCPPGALHVSYIHAPMRYLWDADRQYFQFGRLRLAKRLALGAVSPYLRRFDLAGNRGVDWFVANSSTVAKRMQRHWGAPAEVIPPPVDTEFFTPSEASRRGDFHLIVSSLEPYKRIDLAIEAFRRLGSRLVIVGDGTLRSELRRIAPTNVEFTGRISDEKLRGLYRDCRALVFTGVEDFGIAPVEAMACGAPVIGYARGGLTETVEDGRTGALFEPQTAGALADALRRADALSFDAGALRRGAERFSRKQFRDKMVKFLQARVPLPFDFPAES